MPERKGILDHRDHDKVSSGGRAGVTTAITLDNVDITVDITKLDCINVSHADVVITLVRKNRLYSQAGGTADKYKNGNAITKDGMDGSLTIQCENEDKKDTAVMKAAVPYPQKEIRAKAMPELSGVLTGWPSIRIQSPSRPGLSTLRSKEATSRRLPEHTVQGSERPAGHRKEAAIQKIS